jgi:hypothetical protein
MYLWWAQIHVRDPDTEQIGSWSPWSDPDPWKSYFSPKMYLWWAQNHVRDPDTEQIGSWSSWSDPDPWKSYFSSQTDISNSLSNWNPSYGKSAGFNFLTEKRPNLRLHGLFSTIISWICPFKRLKFQRIPSFNCRYFQFACISTTIFKLHEGGNSMHCTTLFVCPARWIASLCLWASAFPIILLDYIIK